MLQIPKLLLDLGAIRALPDELNFLRIRKPLLMSDAGLSSCGVVARVRQAAPAIMDVFDRVTENPVLSDCDAAAHAYRIGCCDGIVALGGGSVIDAAKLTAVVVGQGGCAADFAGRSEQITASAAALVAVPTTAGTGSEATSSAGVHPDAFSRPTNTSSPFITPRLALCDPELTTTLPRRLTAATGIDALTHCIEGYLSPTPSPMIDAIALDGIRRTCDYLDRAVVEGGDRNARWHMMLAAFEGGVAIQKGLGPAHAMAIACGNQGVHHGMRSAIGLLATLRILAEPCASKMRDIAAAMGLPAGETVSVGLSRLMTRLDLPTTLAGAGYEISSLDELASNAAESFFNATSPYRTSAGEYRTMIASIAG